MRVVVLTVGDEILSGDIVDSNSAWLGRELTGRGASVERMVTVPDDVEVIAETVRETSARFDAVVVTGGLGPTHDDLTMAGVASAFDVPLTEHPDAVAYFEDHDTYRHADLAAGTTHLPEGARLLPNDTGVAPGCQVANVYVLPGVPGEMKAMFAAVAEEFSGTVRHVRFVYVDEPESALLDRLDDLQARFDVTVGSYPGEVVRIKLQSTDQAELDGAAAWLRERVAVAAQSGDYPER